MKNLLVLVMLGVICTIGSALECRTCQHQAFVDIDDNDEAKERSEEIGMWNENCLDNNQIAKKVCDEDTSENQTSYKPICFAMTVTSNYTYNTNYTGTPTNASFNVNLYMRGCLNVTVATENGKLEKKEDIDLYKERIEASIDDKEGMYGEFDGTLELCDAEDCNTDKLKPVSGSEGIRASTALLVAMAAVLAWWRQA